MKNKKLPSLTVIDALVALGIWSFVWQPDGTLGGTATSSLAMVFEQVVNWLTIDHIQGHHPEALWVAIGLPLVLLSLILSVFTPVFLLLWWMLGRASEWYKKEGLELLSQGYFTALSDATTKITLSWYAWCLAVTLAMAQESRSAMAVITISYGTSIVIWFFVFIRSQKRT